MKNKIFKTLLLSASLSLKAYSMENQNPYREEGQFEQPQLLHGHNEEEFEYKSQGQIFSENVRNGLQGKEHSRITEYDIPVAERYVRLAIEMILESLRLSEMAKNPVTSEEGEIAEPVSAQVALNAGQDMFADLIQSSAHNYNYEHNYEYENSDNSSVHSSNSSHKPEQSFDEEEHTDNRVFTINDNVTVFVDKDNQYYYVDDYNDEVLLSGEYCGHVYEHGELKLKSGKMHVNDYGHKYEGSLYYDVETDNPFTGQCNEFLYINGEKRLLIISKNKILDLNTNAPANGTYEFRKHENQNVLVKLKFDNGRFISEDKFEVPANIKNQNAGYDIESSEEGHEYHNMFTNGELEFNKKYKALENSNKLEREQSKKESEAFQSAINSKLTNEENARLILLVNKSELSENERKERDALILRKNAQKYYEELERTKNELSIQKTQNEALYASRDQFQKKAKYQTDAIKKIKRETSRQKRGASRVKHH